MVKDNKGFKEIISRNFFFNEALMTSLDNKTINSSKRNPAEAENSNQIHIPENPI